MKKIKNFFIINLFLISSIFAQDNYSLSFTGSSDDVTVAHQDDMNLFGGNNPMSITFWSKRSSDGEMHYMGKRAGQNNCSFQIAGTGQNIGIGGSVGNWSALSLTSPSELVNNWNHINHINHINHKWFHHFFLPFLTLTSKIHRGCHNE